jgi:AraC family transcriptional regulator
MAEHQSTRVLVKTRVVQVLDVVCWAPRSGYGPAMFNTAALIGLPRRGAFILERQGRSVVVDTNTALVLGCADEYRISHPTSHGDEGTVVILPPHLLEDATGGTEGRVGRLDPRHHLAVCVVTRALADPQNDDLEAEDLTLMLLATLSRTFDDPTDEKRCGLGPAQRLRVEHARALLASSPATRWNLDLLGMTLGCSPFHLARQFRTATGETISRYLFRLRLALAVERLADGDRDIASLATDIGFANHSHFTSRFRTMFGVTPRQARDMLTKRKLAELRPFVAEASK